MKAFKKHCNSGLFTSKSHCSDYAVKSLRVFGTLFDLDVLSFEQYNMNTKQAYKLASLRNDTPVNATVNRLERQLCRLDFSIVSHIP